MEYKKNMRTENHRRYSFVFRIYFGVNWNEMKEK